MNPAIPIANQPLVVPITLHEGYLTYIPAALAALLALAVVAVMLAWVLRGFFYWLLDNFVFRWQPVLVFRNQQNTRLDEYLPIAGKCKFDYGKRPLPMGKFEEWKPGTLKIKRRMAWGKEVKVKGVYLPYQGKQLVKFQLSSGQSAEQHTINGLDDFEFFLLRDASEKNRQI